MARQKNSTKEVDLAWCRRKGLSVPVAHQLPEWFACAERVSDLYARSADAEFVLDEFEERTDGIPADALEWRECMIPKEAFQLPARLDEVEWLRRHSAMDPPGEQRRMADIGAWVARCGGIGPALAASPLLVTLDEEGAIHIEDGNHRLLYAVYFCKARAVHALCALLPTMSPEMEQPLAP